MTLCILECSRKTQQQIHTYIQYPYICIWRSSAHRPISKAHKSESFPPRRQSAVQRLIGRGKLCESTCCWFSLKLFCCHIKCCYYKLLIVVGVISNSNTYTIHREHGHQQRRRQKQQLTHSKPYKRSPIQRLHKRSQQTRRHTYTSIQMYGIHQQLQRRHEERCNKATGLQRLCATTECERACSIRFTCRLPADRTVVNWLYGKEISINTATRRLLKAYAYRTWTCRQLLTS